MTEGSSVLEKAMKLQGEIRRLDMGAQDDARAQRVSRRVHELREKLGALKQQIAVVHALRKNTTVDIGLSDLENGRADLARRGSLPSDQAFNAARKKVEDTTQRLVLDIQSAWKAWADEQLASLPVSRIPMLDLKQQEHARSTHKELRSYAGVPKVTPTDITLFATRYAGLKEELEQTPEAPATLLALLSRLSESLLTLRDLTDDDVALLRAHGVDGEIELRRRGA